MIAVGLLLFPVPALAVPQAETTATTEAAKKVCKVDPEDTDSRIRRRICKTEAEWNSAKVHKVQSASQGNSTSGGGE